MREYIVTSPLDHDGKHYAIGDTVQLDDLVAATLIATRTVAEPELAEISLTETLRGSDYLPALIRMSSTLTVPQTEIVKRAFDASGLDVTGWNGLADDDRELRITGAAELVREQELGPILSAAGLGLGQRAAMAEGERALADNQTAAPEERLATEIVEGAGVAGPGGALAGAAAAAALTPADGGPTAGAGTTDRVGSIRGVLARLVAGADFTAGGEPKIEAVERLAGFRPSRAEIDAARVPPVPLV